MAINVLDVRDTFAAPRVRVQWPDGMTEDFGEVALDRWFTVEQGSGAAR